MKLFSKRRLQKQSNNFNNTPSKPVRVYKAPPSKTLDRNNRTFELILAPNNDGNDRIRVVSPKKETENVEEREPHSHFARRCQAPTERESVSSTSKLTNKSTITPRSISDSLSKQGLSTQESKTNSSNNNHTNNKDVPSKNQHEQDTIQKAVTFGMAPSNPTHPSIQSKQNTLWDRCLLPQMKTKGASDRNVQAFELVVVATRNGRDLIGVLAPKRSTREGRKKETGMKSVATQTTPDLNITNESNPKDKLIDDLISSTSKENKSALQHSNDMPQTTPSTSQEDEEAATKAAPISKSAKSSDRLSDHTDSENQSQGASATPKNNIETQTHQESAASSESNDSAIDTSNSSVHSDIRTSTSNPKSKDSREHQLDSLETNVSESIAFEAVITSMGSSDSSSEVCMETKGRIVVDVVESRVVNVVESRKSNTLQHHEGSTAKEDHMVVDIVFESGETIPNSHNNDDANSNESSSTGGKSDLRGDSDSDSDGSTSSESCSVSDYSNSDGEGASSVDLDESESDSESDRSFEEKIGNEESKSYDTDSTLESSDSVDDFYDDYYYSFDEKGLVYEDQCFSVW